MLGDPLMGEKVILEELNYIFKLLEESLDKMQDVIRPKMGSVLWRVFFPAGEFMNQKSNAKVAASILINIDARLQEMIQVLTELNHPIIPSIKKIYEYNLLDLGNKLVEIPERAQYIIPRLESIEVELKRIIDSINN